MALFGYDENVMSGILKGLVQTILTMGTDVEKYESKAKELEEKAAEKEKEAEKEESDASLIDLNPQKDVQDYTTDEKGNQVPDGTHKETDEAQKAKNIATRDSLLQNAAQAKKEAANNRANAAQLRRLAAGLRLLKGDVEAAQKNFQLAADNTKKAVTESTNLLVAGASMIGKVISVFNVPEAKNVGDWAKGFGNNVLKTFLGVDLSDGIDTDEVNKIAGIVVDTAATVVSGFTSIVVSSLVASTPIGGTGLASLAGVTARGGTNFLLNLGRDTAAKAVSKNFVSGLNFLGIKVKEPEEKDGKTEKVELDGESAEAAAAAVSGNQSELGNGEEATAGTQKPSFDELALEIRQGKWGNGHQTRQQRLMEAGYITTPEEYEEIRKLVNAQIAENPPDDPPDDPPEDPPAKNANQWLRGKKAQIAELRQQKGELERNGASKKDIDTIDAKIDKLEKERDKYYESDRGVRTTNAQIAELRQQKGELERNGASKKDIDEIQSKINDAEKVRDGYSNERNNVLKH